MHNKPPLYHGFSLLGLVVLVSVLMALFSAALYILKPARQYALENNTVRLQNIYTIANALGGYLLDHEGKLPPLTTTNQEIAGAGVDLCPLLIPQYLVSLPKDPSINEQDITACTPTYKTHYYIKRTATGFAITARDTAVPPATAPFSVERKLFKH